MRHRFLPRPNGAHHVLFFGAARLVFFVELVDVRDLRAASIAGRLAPARLPARPVGQATFPSFALETAVLAMTFHCKLMK